MMRQERNKVMVYYVRVIQKESFYGLQRKIIECNNTCKSAFQNKTLSMGLFSMRGWKSRVKMKSVYVQTKRQE